MIHKEELARQAVDACLTRLWTNTVAVVNSIRMVGIDVTTGRRGDGETSGTACASRWGDHHFILTASHVIDEKARPSDLRVFWRPSGEIERRSAANLRKQDIGDAVPIKDATAVIHRCKWEDLAVVTVSVEEAGPFTEFFDIANEWIDPLEGEIVSCCGFPIDRGPIVERKMIGNKEERVLAIYPFVFSGPVLPLPTEEELRYKITAFDPQRHYLVPFPDAADGRHPLGISGGAMWWETNLHQIVWRPNFKFAGICTSCYKRGALEQVVKASVVRRFLEEVFGPAP